MLPRQHRLRDGSGFGRAVRSGARQGSRLVVVHAATCDRDLPARVGFVVSKQVGNSVVRNRVRRRLQHLVAELLSTLPRGSVLVVRAQPAAAAASYDELRDALVRCLDRVSTAVPGGVR